MQNPSPLPSLIQSQAAVYGNRAAMLYRDDELQKWKEISWENFARTVSRVSASLLELGVGVQENIATFSQNMPECMYVDFGAYGIRAVTIPFYATASEMQVKYMVSDAKIRYIFVGEQYQYDTAYRILKIEHSMQRLIIFDPSVEKDSQDNVSLYFDEFLALSDGKDHAEEIARLTAEVQEDDLANILYTSGTTGISKGVMLTHRMYNAAFRGHVGALPLTHSDLVMNFLPFTHVFERGWSYLCLKTGCTLAVNRRPADILQSLREVHPTCMCAVPRFWEKVYAGVQEKMNSSSPIQRRMLEDALRIGKAYNVDYKMRGLVPPLALKMRYVFYEKTVINTLKKVLGLENAKFFPTAGAAVSNEVCEFVHAVGINMIVGYGLTESFATVCCYPLEHYVPGSVGLLIPSLKVKIDPETEEILLKGPTIMKGYYKREDANAKAFTEDGYFRTGDTGWLEGRTLFIKERIKDLMKTSNGKYISPQALEAKLGIDRFIEQVAIIADGRKFVSALIVPSYEALKEFATQKGITYQSIEELLENKRVLDLFQNRIDTLQQEFAHYEQIKRFTLLPTPFSMENGELTNTLKLRRRVVAQNYKDVIDKMYEES